MYFIRRNALFLYLDCSKRLYFSYINLIMAIKVVGTIKKHF